MDKKRSKKELSEEEVLIFREAMKHAKPIKQVNKVLLKKKIAVRPKEITEDHIKEDPHPLLSNLQTEKDVTPQEQLFFVRSGLSPKQIRRLRQGKIPIVATLDLHGFSSESARQELIKFIDFAYRNKKRCISIIHGKGHSEKPVLKNKINNWLRQLDEVLAFCTALPKHGGTGAVYVLLKAQRDQI